MIRMLISTALFGLIASAAMAQDAASLDRAVREDVAHGFSGAVLVARGDAILLDRGYGSIAGEQVTNASRFWIASGGKQFTAAAIMRCRDKGWLTLDDPLSRFFPGAPDDKRGITIRQLLSHTSGLDQTYASEGANTRAEAVSRMFSHPLIDKPGNKFHYSNDNYQLAAAIVEVASHSDYRAFVRRELFAPAGLTGTGYAGDEGAKAVLPGANPEPDRLIHPGWGAEGAYSTTGDLYRWYRALAAGRVLSKRSVHDLFAPAAPISEGQAALGWFIGKTDGGAVRRFVRGNEDWGPNSLLYAYPDSGIVIVVLTHAGMANDDLSWSRSIHKTLEAMLLPAAH